MSRIPSGYCPPRPSSAPATRGPAALGLGSFRARFERSGNARYPHESLKRHSNGLGGEETGIVTVYASSNGQLVHTLGAAEFHRVGVSVALGDGYLAAGALGSSPGGGVYLYSTVTGHFIDVLRAEDWQPGDRLGESVDAEGDLVLAGARGDDDLGDWAGAAYLFRVSDGEQVAKLTADDGVENDQFGFSVALSGSMAVIGARQVSGAHSNTGAVYLLDAQSGQEQQKLAASDGNTWDFLGAAVAAWGGAVVATAEEDDDNGPESGSVYVFARPCQSSSYCDALPNSAGESTHLVSTGSTSLAENSFILQASDAVPLQFGLFFYAHGQGFSLFGEGALCVQPPIFRLNPVVLTNGNGFADYAVNFNAPPANVGPGAIDPFSTWNFQYWYRDPLGGTAGFNLSDGLEVTFCP